MKAAFCRIAISFAACLSFPALAQTETQSSSPAPKIAFDSTEYNFGKVSVGEVVRHDFIFTNCGSATLEITSVRPGCGCTTAGTWDKLVEPGKTGIIPLQLNSASLNGTVVKSATITSNDPRQPSSILQLTGLVWRPFHVVPNTAYFTVVGESATNDTKVVRILSQLEESVTVSAPESTNSAFRAEIKTVRPGKEFELHISTVPPVTESTRSTITVKTSASGAPTIQVPVLATVMKAITVAPERITLPPGPLSAPRTMSVLVRNNGTNQLKLSEAHINLSGVTANILEVQAGRLSRVTVEFPAGFDVAATKNVELTFKSNHPKHPEFRVPVVAAASIPRSPQVPLPRPPIVQPTKP